MKQAFAVVFAVMGILSTGFMITVGISDPKVFLFFLPTFLFATSAAIMMD